MSGIAWAAPSEVLTDDTALAEGECALSGEIDLNSCVGMFAIGVKMTYHADATAGAVLRIYGKMDGTNYGAEPIYERGLVLRDEGSSHNQGPIPMPIPCRYVKASIQNLDESQSITGIYLYAHKNVLGVYVL